MPGKSLAFMSELPEAPRYQPVRDAISQTTDAKASAALQLFASMPASTGVLANPVRYHDTVRCNGEPIEVSIRSFGIRGCLFEEDIVTGRADTFRTVFVGLFGRFPQVDELRAFSRLLSNAFDKASEKILPDLAKFMKTFPDATADIAMQYMAAIRKASSKSPEVRSRPPADLLRDLINVHMENCVAGACSSYMRGLLSHRPGTGTGALRPSDKAFSCFAAPRQSLYDNFQPASATTGEFHGRTHSANPRDNSDPSRLGRIEHGGAIPGEPPHEVRRRHFHCSPDGSRLRASFRSDHGYDGVCLPNRACVPQPAGSADSRTRDGRQSADIRTSGDFTRRQEQSHGTRPSSGDLSVPAL